MMVSKATSSLNYTGTHCYYTPRTTKLLGGGVYWFHSVRPSVLPSVRPSRIRPASRVRSVASTVFWLDPFHIYASYKATSEGVLRAKFLAKCQNLKLWQFCRICNFDFVLFWLGIWCESLVWVIMGRRGVSQNADVLVVLVVPIINGVHIYHLLIQNNFCWFEFLCLLTTGYTFDICILSHGELYYDSE